MTVNEFTTKNNSSIIRDRDTIDAIMKELPKIDVVPLIRSVEKRYKLAKEWKASDKTDWVATLNYALGLPDDAQSRTLGYVARQTKKRYPDYIDSTQKSKLFDLCNCLTLLSFDYAARFYKNKVI